MNIILTLLYIHYPGANPKFPNTDIAVIAFDWGFSDVIFSNIGDALGGIYLCFGKSGCNNFVTCIHTEKRVGLLGIYTLPGK